MNSIALSVLDLSPVVAGEPASKALQETLDLARFVEALGFKRYWTAEHHSMAGIASASPEIVIGHIAQVTSRMRVGSGGIMLPNHTPLRIAEAFRTLEAFHPGRIDLGVGRAPGTNSATAVALRGSLDKLRAEDFPQELAALKAYLTIKTMSFPKFVGSPSSLARTLGAFLAESTPDELMILTMVPDHELRKESYALIHQVFNS